MSEYLNKTGLAHLWSRIKAELGGKAASSHRHSISDVTNLGALIGSSVVTLGTTGWTNNSITVAATGVSVDKVVIVSPIQSQEAAYKAAGVKCTSKGTNSLTFTREQANTVALTVNIMILGVSS